MNTSTLIKLAIGALLAIVLFVFAGNFISFSNTEVGLRNTFEQKIDERTAFYDGMKKIFAGKAQIATKNDESFRKNIDIIMTSRKDGEQVMMKWITESNPNANYQEVSKLYSELSRAIEAKREGFFEQEKVLQDIVRQHKMHLQTFPNVLYNMFLNRQPLVYKVIQSDETAKVMTTGRDNNDKLDL